MKKAYVTATTYYVHNNQLFVKRNKTVYAWYKIASIQLSYNQSLRLQQTCELRLKMQVSFADLRYDSSLSTAQVVQPSHNINTSISLIDISIKNIFCRLNALS